MKLIQKHFLKGTREFEIKNDAVFVHIKRPFKEERLTIGLSMINPEPSVNEANLEFHGHSDTKPLLSLSIDKPDAEQFGAFIDAIKRGAGIHGDGVRSATAEGLARNVYDEPPPFEACDEKPASPKIPQVNPKRVEETIQLLERFLVEDEIKPLLKKLDALKNDPHNETCFLQMKETFESLGIMQGAVLTYAPYISILLADDPLSRH